MQQHLLLYRTLVAGATCFQRDLTSSGFQVVVAEVVSEAVSRLLADPPVSVVVVDGASNQEAVFVVKHLRGMFPRVSILAVTPEAGVTSVIDLMHAGANNVVQRPCEVRAIVSAIIAMKPTTREADGLFLAERERQVFDLLGDGFCASELAETLGLSIKTIDGTMIRLRGKLGCPDTKTLRRLAVTRKRQAMVAEVMGRSLILVEHEQLDFEHGRQFACIKELEQALLRGDSDGILGGIDEIIAAAGQHSRAEERLMLASSYPRTEEHLAQHKLLIGEMETFRCNLLAGKISMADFHAFVVHWFVTHLETYDRDLARHINGYYNGKRAQLQVANATSFA